MTDPIPNCPQEDKPIRDRAWTDGQALQELRNIATAKRFDKSVFATDTDFADWAQSRCRHIIGAKP